MSDPRSTSTAPLGLPEKLRPVAADLALYYRELPRLLKEGEAGRFLVIRDGQFFGSWDTFRDALRYGHEKFPDGRFLAQRIDARDIERLAAYFPQAEGA